MTPKPGEDPGWQTAAVRARSAIIVASVFALVGCGNSRTRVPSFEQPATAAAVRLISYPAAGVSVRVPDSWTVAAATPPLLATISSGAATVALWSHPRRDPPPADHATLVRLERRLLNTARRLDPTLTLIGASVSSQAGHPAVELDALEHVSGRLRRVRSVHVFTAGAEVVIDAYAPPANFHAVDHAVFSPLKRTLRLTGPAA